MDSSLSERWAAVLELLRAEGRYRRLAQPRGVDFSSNDYLGFGKEPPPLGDLSRSGQASRLLRGQHPIWEEVETALARWHGAEAALLFSSGYLANLGLLSTLVEPQDFLACDQANHASLIDGARLSRADKFIFPHNDLDHLETGLRTAAKNRPLNRQLFIVTESLFGMEGDRAPLAELAALAGRYQAHLLVDEAHATGCFGPAGSGCVDEAGLRSQVLATMHTGGKALGVPGAYLAGSAQLKDLLINRCRQFIFTTALPPVVGAWWRAALRQVQAAQDRRAALQRAAVLFREELQRHGIHPLGQYYLVPLIVGGDTPAVQAAQRLQEAGWDIRAIRPPTVPPGTARLRISIHADHDPATLRAAAAAVAEAVQSCPEGAP